MDFTQQLQACVAQANQALSRFIAPLPFQNTPVVEAMQYGALLGGKRLRPFLVYATVKCLASVRQRWMRQPQRSNASMHIR
ncbi:geranyltranstransferase [Salmonella enterica subsp. arizonae]|uniref:Geranyltranstransferase n=1 Tax=Salmonella enterica subsp. arizonae TaxID=59203 RepID=A0A3S4GNT2_SALER|nr:geranyltranstransferase [Salmonella enterica subsp. arizonae]